MSNQKNHNSFARLKFYIGFRLDQEALKVSFMSFYKFDTADYVSTIMHQAAPSS